MKQLCEAAGVRQLILAVFVFIALVKVSAAAPFLSCDYVDEADFFSYMVDEGPGWNICEKEVGPKGIRAKCNLAALPVGGHLIRMKVTRRNLESPGNVFVYIYKVVWKNRVVYYVLKSEKEKLSWEQKAVFPK